MHLVVGLPLNRLVVPNAPPAPVDALGVAEEAALGDRRAMALLASSFAATWMVSTAMAAHLPALLRAAGASAATAVAAASLVGPAQVAARVASKPSRSTPAAARTATAR